MKNLFKSWLVWCMLLAVPLQGYASATALLCAPLQSAARTIGPLHGPAPAHDHGAMMLAQHADGLHAVNAMSAHDANASDASDQAASNHDAGGKCNACSACCFGAAMVASQAMPMPVEPRQWSFIHFKPGFAPAVDLALPERPPQTSRV